MTLEQTSRLLNEALNIIVSLEEYASEQTHKDIEALFQEVGCSDWLDADMEAQDYEVFGQDKI